MANKKVVAKIKGDSILTKPSILVDLTEFFDSIEVDVEADLSDWHKIRRELGR